MNPFSWLNRKRAGYWALMVCSWRRHKHHVEIVQVEKKYKRSINELFIQRLEDENEGKEGIFRMHEMPVPQWTVKPYVPPMKIKCNDGKMLDEHVMAMDDQVASMWQSYDNQHTMGMTGLGFPGFPYLNELTQISEYRDISERTAKEMCRKWVKFRSTGDKKHDKEIKEIEAELVRLHVKSMFERCAVLDGFFGRGQIYLDFGDEETHDAEELASKLLLQHEKVNRKHPLKALKVIEPITTYPAAYNSTFPLRQDYYEPSSWWVYGNKVDASRMLTFVSRPLPDLLKPIYNFSGMSLSQLAKPYVDYWMSTRDSVGRLLKNFSCSVLKTDLSAILQGEGYDEFLKRARMFNALRDNQGLMVLDNEGEAFEKHETSLSGLDKLQAQAQEHMAVPAKTPLTILLGITPTGLNSTAEGDITIYNNHVNNQQESIFRPNLERLVKFVMLSLFDEIYDDITFDFVDLVSQTEKEKALMRKSEGETDQVYVTIGAVSPEEVRGKIAADPDSGYDDLDVDHPEGKLGLPPPPAGSVPPPGAKGAAGAKGAKALAGGTQAKAQAENAAETNSAFNSPGDAITQDHAYQLWLDAMAEDEFNGNQHTGGIGGAHDSPLAKATKLSSAAQRSTNRAWTAGSKAAHVKAQHAHQRALAAHEAALGSATSNLGHVHRAFIDAHHAAIIAHGLKANGA
jgi:phage-related protein (TIGR01555 family)